MSEPRETPRPRRTRSAKGSPRKASARAQETLAVDRDAVRHWRLQRGHTQESLARQRVELDGQSVSISYAQIRRIEADGRCGPGTARILAALLGVPIGRLSPSAPHQRPCGVPREVSTDFVGREQEIKAVLAVLRNQGAARIATSVEGLPGVGKTELALQVCALCEPEFRIFWFDAEQPDLTPTWADVVAPHLGIDAQDAQKRAQKAVQAVEALAEPVLLVLDNVEQWSASRPWPRPRGRHIHWLVTTRSSALGGREFQHVELPVLAPQAAEELMLRIAGEAIAQQPGFHPLLETLGGYTISVELAATFLKRFPDVTPAQYLHDLEAGRGFDLEDEVGDRTLYGSTLQSALDLLWARLPTRVRELWLLAAAFAQASATPALSDACGLDRRARATLADYHLIQNLSAHGWSMHRLIRSFGRRAAETEDRQAALRRFIRGCTEKAQRMSLDDGFLLYLPDRAHFDRAIDAARSTAEAGQPAPDDLLGIANLACRVGGARCSHGDFQGATALLERELPKALEDLGLAHELPLELQRIMGWTLLQEGELAEARRVLENALTQADHNQADAPDVLASIRDMLGAVLGDQGDINECDDQQ